MIPSDLGRAARAGRTQYVLEQLATHGFDVNAQVEGEAGARMTLLSCCCCEIGGGQLALARALLDMGADPNLFRDEPLRAPLYNVVANPSWVYTAAHGIGEADYEMVLLLLNAGADVHLGSEHGLNPLVETIRCFERRDRHTRRPYLHLNSRKIVRLLLRSGVALDGIDDAFRRLDPALGVGSTDYVHEARRHYTASRNLICDVRTAGGLRKYETMPRKQVLTLRTMALRGRAAPRDNVMSFLVDCPNEIAWKILSYWRTEIYCDDGLLFIDRLSDESVEAMLWTENAGLARREIERRRERWHGNRFQFRIRDWQSETYFYLNVHPDARKWWQPCQALTWQWAFDAYAAHRKVSVSSLRFFRNGHPLPGDKALGDFDSYWHDGDEFDVMSCGLANWCILIRGQVEKNSPWPWDSDLLLKIYSLPRGRRRIVKLSDSLSSLNETNDDKESTKRDRYGNDDDADDDASSSRSPSPQRRHCRDNY